MPVKVLIQIKKPNDMEVPGATLNFYRVRLPINLLLALSKDEPEKEKFQLN
jgi:hypothetical protein